MGTSDSLEYTNILASKTPFSIVDSLIMCATVGSESHGTKIDGSPSDTDIRGIVIPPPGIVLGLEHWETVNTKVGPVDVELHSLDKIVKLAIKGNPTVLELLWLEDRFYSYRHPIFDTLRSLRDLFSSLASFEPFKGFATSQVKRMQEGDHGNSTNEVKLARINEFGYDTKMAAHSVRILREGTEFMATGQLNVYRDKDAEELKNIKSGSLSLEEVKTMVEWESLALEAAYLQSKLPATPNKEVISNVLVDLTKKFWGSKRWI